MAQTTMELRHVLEITNIFDFEYEMADSNWKKEFEKLFKDYYYMYEIKGTIDLFKHRLRTRINLLMPYYNELYNSKLFEINPLLTKKITETIDEDITDSSSQSTSMNNSSDNESTSTDYPQSPNFDDNIPSGKTKDNGTSTSSSSTTFGSDKFKDYKRIIEGFEGNQNELLSSYRKNIININKMLLDEFKTLFILVY